MSKTPLKTLYFDGGCAPNPGQMSACIVMDHGGASTSTIPFVAQRLGYGTNNVAEWSALVWAATYAVENELEDLIIRGDSQLVVNQANGKFKCSPKLMPWLEAYRELARGRSWRLEHVYRDQNLAGRHLESL